MEGGREGRGFRGGEGSETEGVWDAGMWGRRDGLHVGGREGRREGVWVGGRKRGKEHGKDGD